MNLLRRSHPEPSADVTPVRREILHLLPIPAKDNDYIILQIRSRWRASPRAGLHRGPGAHPVRARAAAGVRRHRQAGAAQGGHQPAAVSGRLPVSLQGAGGAGVSGI